MRHWATFCDVFSFFMFTDMSSFEVEDFKKYPPPPPLPPPPCIDGCRWGTVGINVRGRGGRSGACVATAAYKVPVQVSPAPPFCRICCYGDLISSSETFGGSAEVPSDSLPSANNRYVDICVNWKYDFMKNSRNSCFLSLGNICLVFCETDPTGGFVVSGLESMMIVWLSCMWFWEFKDLYFPIWHEW